MRPKAKDVEREMKVQTIRKGYEEACISLNRAESSRVESSRDEIIGTT